MQLLLGSFNYSRNIYLLYFLGCLFLKLNQMTLAAVCNNFLVLLSLWFGHVGNNSASS